MVNIVLLIILAIAVIRGFFKGLSYELLSLICVIISLAIAYFTFGIAPEWLTNLGLSEKTSAYIVALGIFIIAQIVLQLIGRTIIDGSKIKALGLLDNLVGMILSLLKYSIILAILVRGVYEINSEHSLFDPSILDESKLFQIFYNISVSFENLIKSIH